MAYIQTRQTSDGNTRYRVQVRLRGHPTQTATFDRKTDAKKWAQDIESAVRDGRHFKDNEAKRHTVAELVDRYVKSVAPTLKTAKDRVRHLERWKSELGHLVLADATPSVIADVRDKLLAESTARGEKRNPATVVRYLATLSHAFSIATKQWGWVQDNPLLKVRKPKEPRGRVRFLSDSERETLLKACGESKNPVLYPVVVLALSTGMRQGEILNLTWADVDLAGGRITLHDTKNNERRVVPLAGHAMSVMKDYAKVRRLDTSLVFPGRSPTSQNPMDIRVPWNTAVRQAGIKDFRFHDLRHSAASYLAMNGASLAEIAEVLGHRTLQMVQRYAHLSEAHTAGVVARMNEKIFGAL
jgi:integrase